LPFGRFFSLGSFLVTESNFFHGISDATILPKNGFWARFSKTHLVALIMSVDDSGFREVSS
jgi:hypothetical protein